MSKNKTIILNFFFLLCMAGAFAQNGAVASGGNASGGGGMGGTVSYTVGIIDYKTNGNGSITMAEGIQQPYEIQVVNGLEKTSIELGSVYPNPTADYVVLSLKGELQNMNYTLSDVNGKQIRQQIITKQQTNIPMASLANGAYFVKVYNNKTQLKTYKLIKNN